MLTIDLGGKTAIVTGGDGAIGTAICDRLAEAGANVIIAGIKEEAGRELAVKLTEKYGVRAQQIYCDVTSRESTEEMARRAIDAFGRIDILINNAGVNVGNDRRKPINDFAEEDWHWILDVDLTGTFYCSRPIVDHMIEMGGGRIVNISSIVGLVPVRNTCSFAAAKAGVVNLTKAMALELGSKNITVNCVAPGSVIFEGTRELVYGDPVAAEHMLSFIPMHRPGEDYEISGPVVFLCSDYASYMNGSVVTVDGGWTCGYHKDY